MKLHRFPKTAACETADTLLHYPTGFPTTNPRTDDISLPRSGWLLIGRAAWGIYFNQSKSTTQIWLVTRHQYKIFMLVPQT